jgi:hypothetical protein
MTEAMQPGTARAEGTEPHADGTQGPRPGSATDERHEHQARDPRKDLEMAATARRLEALWGVALDSDRSIAVDHSLELLPEP